MKIAICYISANCNFVMYTITIIRVYVSAINSQIHQVFMQFCSTINAQLFCYTCSDGANATAVTTTLTFERRSKDNTPNAVLQGWLSLLE